MKLLEELTRGLEALVAAFWRRYGADVAVIAGLALVVAGCALFSVPAAMILGGVLLVGGGLLAIYGRTLERVVAVADTEDEDGSDGG